MLKRALFFVLLVVSQLAAQSPQPSPDGGLPRRADLGISLHFNVTQKPTLGAEVRSVTPGGFGERIGVRKGDVVTSINGRAIHSPSQLEAASKIHPGQQVQLTLSRAGEAITVQGKPPEAPRENYSNADVLYDAVTDSKGEKLRTIITRPKSATGRLPAIFVAGWLSCDSVESPADTTDDTGKVFRGLAEMPGFVLFRVDKPGTGDSEALCSETDFSTELSGYRQAFRALKRYDFIDSARVFIFGVSNGGGYAPLVTQGADGITVKGYVAEGGWVKTWFEHMMEIERRRHTLQGESPAQVNQSMKGTAELYSGYLLNGESPAEIFRRKPQLAALWDDQDYAHQYGRPVAFYQQLQKLNLAEVWSRVNVPTLAVHGECDWIMSRDDHELIAAIVNKNHPGAAQFVEVPQMGHGFQHFTSWPDAFNFRESQFDPSVVQLLVKWFEQHR